MQDGLWDGQTNIVYNALDRWMNTDIKNKTALIWSLDSPG